MTFNDLHVERNGLSKLIQLKHSMVESAMISDGFNLTASELRPSEINLNLKGKNNVLARLLNKKIRTAK